MRAKLQTLKEPFVKTAIVPSREVIIPRGTLSANASGSGFDVVLDNKPFASVGEKSHIVPLIIQYELTDKRLSTFARGVVWIVRDNTIYETYA